MRERLVAFPMLSRAAALGRRLEALSSSLWQATHHPTPHFAAANVAQPKLCALARRLSHSVINYRTHDSASPFVIHTLSWLVPRFAHDAGLSPSCLRTDYIAMGHTCWAE